MNKLQQFKAMAGIEFGDKIHIRESNGTPSRLEIVHCPENSYVPAYDTDAEIDRMVRGLDDETLAKYTILLCGIMWDAFPLKSISTYPDFLLKATADQKLEGVLKAHNAWESE